MKISVIIPYKPDEAHLPITLDGVRASVARAPEGVTWEILPIKGAEGVSEARNQGLTAATGEYLAWVDADDEVAPQWATRLVQALSTSPDIVVFDAGVEWVDGKRPGYDISYWRPGGIIDPREFFIDVASAKGIGARLWNRVFRRSLFDGLRFEQASFEDYRIQLDVMKRAHAIVYLPEKLYCYRRTPTGLSQYTDPVGCASALVELGTIAAAERDDRFRHAMHKGIAVMLVDFLFHAGRQLRHGDACLGKKLRIFLLRNIWCILTAKEIGWRVKVKSVLALAR